MQHEIKFTYGEILTSNEAALTMAGGDTVTFSSDQGSVCALLVTGEGSTLRAWEYRTGDQPITLTPFTKYRFCCGVKSGDATIGWPNSDQFGGGFETTAAATEQECREILLIPSKGASGSCRRRPEG